MLVLTVFGLLLILRKFPKIAEQWTSNKNGGRRRHPFGRETSWWPASYRSEKGVGQKRPFQKWQQTATSRQAESSKFILICSLMFYASVITDETTTPCFSSLVHVCWSLLCRVVIFNYLQSFKRSFFS